ncbi:uncharacterized protein LOC122091743 [Macadamia integrifolia]|uniref:uncharacterized protein LOC122091743 n=1 Tax=Macadamia integrifolia TaxID=60698 RepID=UPI001C4FE771|nr:uncharacterized protein LOC122091743 [Macadamia integrifolia]
MLEKIGLPARPSMRGSNWVVAASHCQGCSSQFTFINRKHHCRRCGGLFCNSCTQQRMVLRGQGDSPVRICDPCKNLVEAARFEMRHGHKNRTGRGGPTLTPKYEDEFLNQILDSDGKNSLLSGQESVVKATSMGSASSSSLHDEAFTEDGEGALTRSHFVDTHGNALNETGCTSPEDLRQQSLEEKKKYRVLKGEGKPDEALRAFKRGKELERQAEALEVALRKKRKQAISSGSLADVQKVKDELNSEESGRKSKLSPQLVKEEKVDLTAELRELGWSDTDLHDADKNPRKMSVEGELSALLREMPRKPNSGKSGGSIDKSQVLSHKKKALMFKREGKLAEAKEELRKAKVLEKELEEQELLAEADDSDDELSSLIRSMDDEKPDDFSIRIEQGLGYGFNDPVEIPDNFGLDGNFEVTDEDMDDPEMVAALESVGWTEDSESHGGAVPQATPRDMEVLRSEVLSLKREALNLKRAGNVAEAMSQLKKAKILERDLENFQFPEDMVEGLTSKTTENPLRKMEVHVGTNVSPDTDPKFPQKSKLVIQKELLGLKKKALALRREGRLDEAEEELKKGKVLELQLEQMESAPKVRSTETNFGGRDIEPAYKHQDISSTLVLGEEGDDEDVTDQDMHDPAFLSLLNNLGWKDDDIEPVRLPSRPVKQIVNSERITDPSETEAPFRIPAVGPRKSKSELQRELLGLKRKSLALRRQGEAEEAEEVLRMAKVLEDQIAEMEVPKKELPGDLNKEPAGSGSLISQERHRNNYSVSENRATKPPLRNLVEDEESMTEDMHDPAFSSVLNLGWNDDAEPVRMPAEALKQIVDHSGHGTGSPVIQASSEISVVAPRRNKAEIQRELLGLKRKALTLRRQGEGEEAEEVLRMAKVLEAQIEEMAAPKDDPVNSRKGKEQGGLVSLAVQSQNQNIKAQEVNRVTESEMGPMIDATELSKGFSWKERNDAKPPQSSVISVPETSRPIVDESPTVENFHRAQSGKSLNPVDLLTGDGWETFQLPVEEWESKGTVKSTAKEVGSRDAVGSEIREKSVPVRPAPEVNISFEPNSYDNKSHQQQEIVAHKRKAVSLKREGKLGEARAELLQAKRLEKILNDEHPQAAVGPSAPSVSTVNNASIGQGERKTSNQGPKAISGRDRFKLQQESLAHKRQALKLRREGRIQEAEAEFELAKSLEMQLEELSGHDSLNNSKSTKEAELGDDMGVEDFLDPQLLSALKAVGVHDADIVSQVPERSEATKQNLSKRESSSQERSQLEEKIKAEKVKALNMKRAGNQAGALDALRRAKQLEKKLNP